MKVLKISVFAMALGFFAASCSNGTTNNADESATPETEQMDQQTPTDESMTPADTDVDTTATPDAPQSDATPAE